MPNALPVRRWQARQWQMETTNGSPSTSRRSCPQWQAAMRVTIRAILDTGGYAQALRAVSSAGRAPALQAGGRWFEPGTAHRSSHAGLLDANMGRAWVARAPLVP